MVFEDGQSNNVIQFYPRLSLVAMAYIKRVTRAILVRLFIWPFCGYWKNFV